MMYMKMELKEKKEFVNKTIRLRAGLYERLAGLKLETGMSFNKVVNHCIQHALDNMEELD